MLHFSFTKKFFIVFVLLWGAYYALPNILTETQRNNLPDFFHKEPINLGLDLQGGSHLVLEVDLKAVEKRAYENLEDEVRVIRGVGSDAKFKTRRLNASSQDVRIQLAGSAAEVEEAVATLSSELRGVEVAAEDKNVTLTFTEQRLKEMSDQALEQTLEILRSRVDEFGVAEPAIQRQGENRVIVELPGIDDVERAKGIIGRTANLSFHMVEEGYDASRYAGRRAPRPDLMIAYENSVNMNGEPLQIPYVIKKRPMLTGENLAKASSGFDQNGEAAVFITFDGKGTRKFGEVTTKYTGHRMAILLDGVVYSAPNLREPILGGQASITGAFSVQETNDLSMVLRAGALPAPVKFAEERTIGPSLGKDSIEAGKIAIQVGFLAVLVLMLLFYRGFGLAANIALLLNVVLIVGIMTALGATLTMPGIAGIVLTIGMAVDANVLIFERIREEARKSKTAHSAMAEGFRSAFGTILDANITTLIVAVVLFAMGSGPIKGFALTLSVGIIASMFTAILVTRYILATWLNISGAKKIAV